MSNSPISRAVSKFSERFSGQKIFLAYSGGVDSHVLLYELSRAASAYEISLVALHVNHKLSRNADRWEYHCSQVCKTLGIAYLSCSLDVALKDGHGNEALLRQARYDWFVSLMTDRDVLVTAHHLDDHVETFLYRLIRGAGVDGLLGIPRSRKMEVGRVCRPFRDIWRSDILDFARNNNLTWVEDDTNEDEHYDRNFLRHRVIPLLKSRWPRSPETILRISHHFASVKNLLKEVGEKDLSELHQTATDCHYKNYGKIRIDHLLDFSHERALNLLRAWINASVDDLPSMKQLLELLRQLRITKNESRTRIRWKHAEFRHYRGWLYLLPAQRTPVVGMKEKHWAVNGPIKLVEPGLCIEAHPSVGRGVRVRHQINPLIEISWYRKKMPVKSGGDSKSRTLRNLFQEEGVPPWERWRLPIFCLNGKVAYVPRIGVMNEFSVAEGESGIEILVNEYE